MNCFVFVVVLIESPNCFSLFKLKVQSGHRGVVFNRLTGLKPNAVKEGFHVKIPFLEKVFFFDINQQQKEIRLSHFEQSRRLESVTIRVLFRPVEEKLPSIFRTLGKNYSTVALPSLTVWLFVRLFFVCCTSHSQNWRSFFRMIQSKSCSMKLKYQNCNLILNL